MHATGVKPTSLTCLALVGIMLPMIFVGVDVWLLKSWSVVPLMLALATEIGVAGVLCGTFIRPQWLMWFIYGWMWLLLELMVLPLAIGDHLWGFPVTIDTLPAAILGSQLGLIVVWATLGATRWTIRWPIALLLAVLILVPIVWHQVPIVELLILVTLQSLILLAVCGWLASLRFRLVCTAPHALCTTRITDSPKPETLSRSQFQLRDVLFWTTVLSIILAIARAIDYWRVSTAVWSYIEFGFRQFGVSAVLLPTPASAVCTATVLLIALWSALGTDRAWVRWTFLIVAVLTAAIIYAWFFDYYHRADYWRWPRPYRLPKSWSDFWRTERLVVLWHVLAGAMLFASLLIFRTLGYRICRVPT